MLSNTTIVFTSILIAIIITILVMCCAELSAHETIGTGENTWWENGIEMGPERRHVHASQVPSSELDKVSSLTANCNHAHYVIAETALSGEVETIKEHVLCYDDMQVEEYDLGCGSERHNYDHIVSITRTYNIESETIRVVNKSPRQNIRVPRVAGYDEHGAPQIEYYDYPCNPHCEVTIPVVVSTDSVIRMNGEPEGYREHTHGKDDCDRNIHLDEWLIKGGSKNKVSRTEHDVIMGPDDNYERLPDTDNPILSTTILSTPKTTSTVAQIERSVTCDGSLTVAIELRRDTNYLHLPFNVCNLWTVGDIYSLLQILHPHHFVYYNEGERANGHADDNTVLAPYQGFRVWLNEPITLNLNGEPYPDDTMVEVVRGEQFVGLPRQSAEIETTHDFLELVPHAWAFTSQHNSNDVLRLSLSNPESDVPITAGMCFYIYGNEAASIELDGNNWGIPQTPAGPSIYRTLTTSWGAMKQQ